MKTLLSIGILAMVARTMAHTLTSIEQLEGTWAAEADFPNYFVLTDQGPSAICRDQVTPECKAEAPNFFLSFGFENNTMVTNFSRSIGIDTIEKAAEAYPACAASGIYFLEFVTPGPPFQVVDFDPLQGTVTYIDPRRPDHTSCTAFILGRAGKVPTVTIQNICSFNGTFAELAMIGPVYNCGSRPGFCDIQKSGDQFNIMASGDAILPCVAGPCLDLAKPVVVSKKHFIIAKKASRHHYNG